MHAVLVVTTDTESTAARSLRLGRQDAENSDGNKTEQNGARRKPEDSGRRSPMELIWMHG
jgi:hypothetical protein